jgi:trigger factor
MKSLSREDAFLRDPFAALMPEVAEALVGKKAGDVVTQKVGRTVKNRDGEDVVHEDTYTVTIKEVKTAKVPELNDDFAKDVGEFKSLDELRKRIEDDLKQQIEQEKRRLAMVKIFDHMIEANPFGAPRTIVAAQQYQTIMRDQNYLQQAGLGLEALGLSAERYMQGARTNAERFVKISMLIQSLAKKEGIEANEDDITKEIERRAAAEGRRPLAIRARLEAEKQMEGLKRELLNNKVEDYLIEKNTIREVAPKTPETDAE